MLIFYGAKIYAETRMAVVGLPLYEKQRRVFADLQLKKTGEWVIFCKNRLLRMIIIRILAVIEHTKPTYYTTMEKVTVNDFEVFPFASEDELLSCIDEKKGYSGCDKCREDSARDE